MAEKEDRPKQDIGQDEAWSAKMDREYENYSTWITSLHKQAAEELAQINSITTQALQGAVESANMISKQALRHGDIAIDRQWNVDEQGFTVEKILGQPFVEAINAAVVAAVTAALAGKKKI